MKTVKRVLALSLVLVLVLASACSGGKVNSQISSEDNLVEKATIDGELYGKEGHSFDIKFSSKITVNTLTMEEDGDNITEFSILAYNDATQMYDTVYTQQEIGKYRYCAFSDVKTSALRVKITGATEKFKIKNVAVYNAKHLINENESKFRVTSYVTGSSIQKPEQIDLGTMDIVTDFILFGLLTFDENGQLHYVDQEVDGQKIDGKVAFDTALSNLRQAIGDRDINIYVNVLGPNADEGIEDWNKSCNNKADKHTKAFKSGKLSSYINQFMKDHGIDGISFDYEYPLRNKDWKAFNDFLLDIRSEIGNDKRIAIAVTDWNLKISKKAADVVDVFELMSYDLFDERGDHASFNTAVADINSAVKKGIDPSKIDLGLPFYARPTDSGSYWYDYASEAETLGKFGNYSDAKSDDIPYSEVGRYYNGYQMIYDKTAYALDYGVGGVMVWHQACDLPVSNELSLFRSISQVVETRAK